MLLACLLAWSTAAWASCDDYRALEREAAQGRLALDLATCLEGARASGAPEDRVQASFVLIVDAYANRHLDRYEQLMREHLALAPNDPEVAFLLATYLHRTLGRSDDEVMHWAKVALDGRRRWVGNRENHDDMVRSLYDTLVEAGMERAIAAAQADSPDEARYKREAKYWLAIAGPCLHNRDCGPYYEVEVEGYADCDDLDLLESKARRDAVSDAEASCLRSRYRHTAAPRDRILALLVDWANAGTEPERWEELRGWHWRVTELEDPAVLIPHARWLAAHGDPVQALDTAELALSFEDIYRGRAGAELRREVLQLIVAQAALARVPWRARAAREELGDTKE